MAKTVLVRGKECELEVANPNRLRFTTTLKLEGWPEKISVWSYAIIDPDSPDPALIEAMAKGIWRGRAGVAFARFTEAQIQRQWQMVWGNSYRRDECEKLQAGAVAALEALAEFERKEKAGAG